MNRQENEIEQGSLFAQDSLIPSGLILGRIVQLSGPPKTETKLERNRIPALCRSTDSVTSRSAAEKASKFTGKHEAAIYAAICDSGGRGMTYREIAKATGMEPVAVARRLGAMERRLLVSRFMNEFKEPAEVREGCAVWWRK